MDLYVRCEQCGGKFIPARSTARFCSAKCRVYWNRGTKSVFPESMTSRVAWVRADRKRPIRPDGSPASSTDPATWSAFADVQRGEGDGFGVMLGAGLGCWDFDHCVVDGVVSDEVRALVEAIAEPVVFVELSMSRSGVHVFVEADEVRGTRRAGVEFYSRARFIRVTGNRISL